jgi:hypothetical protein
MGVREGYEAALASGIKALMVQQPSGDVRDPAVLDDLLTNLRHAAKLLDLDFDRAVEVSLTHFTPETEGHALYERACKAEADGHYAEAAQLYEEAEGAWAS